MAFVVVCCSFAQAAVVSSGSQNNLIEMTISQQQDPSYRLLSAMVVKTDNGFCCVETVYTKEFVPNSMSAIPTSEQTASIRLTHTWYRSGTMVCALQINPSFCYTGSSAYVKSENMRPAFQQGEPNSAYALGNLTAHNSNSANDKASIVQPYTVSDKYGNTSTSSFRAYCTVTGVCTGNNNESHNF
jgi:hypothetical protein